MSFPVWFLLGLGNVSTWLNSLGVSTRDWCGRVGEEHWQEPVGCLRTRCEAATCEYDLKLSVSLLLRVSEWQLHAITSATYMMWFPEFHFHLIKPGPFIMVQSNHRGVGPLAWKHTVQHHCECSGAWSAVSAVLESGSRQTVNSVSVNWLSNFPGGKG